MITTDIKELEGYDISVSSLKDGTFRVKYGEQVTNCTTYQDCASEIGYCVMHALCCESRVEDKGTLIKG